MENKQTAVQTLLLSLDNSRPEQWVDIILNDKDKILQMEREQIEAACIYGINLLDEHNEKIHSSEYYTQTFKP